MALNFAAKITNSVLETVLKYADYFLIPHFDALFIKIVWITIAMLVNFVSNGIKNDLKILITHFKTVLLFVLCPYL